MPIPCVDVAIIYEGKILLAHRLNKPAKGTYWFPGGRVMKGETLSQAAKRKAKEETGLDIRIIKQLGTEETIFPDGPFDGPTHTINTVFLAVCKKGHKLKADSQSDSLLWFKTLPKNSPTYIKKFTKLAKKSYGKNS